MDGAPEEEFQQRVSLNVQNMASKQLLHHVCETKMRAREILGHLEFMLLYLKVPKPFFLYLFPLPFKTSISEIVEAFLSLGLYF